MKEELHRYLYFSFILSKRELSQSRTVCWKHDINSSPVQFHPFNGFSKQKLCIYLGKGFSNMLFELSNGILIAFTFRFVLVDGGPHFRNDAEEHLAKICN